MHLDVEDIWHKFWRDDRGHIVIWQNPNIPLIVWAVFTVLSLLFNGTIADVFSWIATAALFVWAILEVTKGVNYFRRVLGLVVLIFTIMSVLNMLK